MKYKGIITALFLALALGAMAEVPNGYYNSLNGISSPQTLKNTIYGIIHNHTAPTDAAAYDAYYNNLPSSFRLTDVRPGTEYWWDMYSNMDVWIYGSFGQYMNREHSFPKSWWGGTKTIPPYVDLFHLYPGNAAANMAKSNYPLGEVDTKEKLNFDNGVSLVGSAVFGQGGGARYVFEPADEYKGDFARTYFYMVTCYQDLTWETKYMFMLQQNTYPTLAPWASELLLRWSKNDPVDEKEIQRNEAVYRIQNNRNPFIDLPGIEQYIWGDKQGQTYEISSGGSTTEPNLFSPIQGMALDFGQCSVGKKATAQLLFTGENLTGNISLMITGADRDQFSIQSRTLSAAVVNQTGGYYLTITFTPKSEGEKHASLTVYDVDGWAPGAMLSVDLIGQGEGVPTLQTIKALPASDITANSYIANWEVPQGDVVDYYIVNRTRYVDGKAEVTHIDAESNALAIDDYDPSVSESYTVQSYRLGYLSPESNVIYVNADGIQGVEMDEPLTVEVYPGCLRLMCGTEQTNLRVYDLAGRLLLSLPKVARNDEITLPVGAYMLLTDQHRTPVKVLVR